ncbi:MAG: hypothetical protein U9P00_01225 [Pseudomonadota bacterium]|nr:hypothetical protein [Pseudomonadota bacterium]
MTQISRQATTVTAPGVARPGREHITGIRFGLILAAIACALFAQALRADEPNDGSVAPAAAIQVDAPAAAVTEKPNRAAEQKAAPQAAWKPPRMPEPAPFSTQKLDPEVVKELKERWGVELLGIRNTAAGNFMDFRFKVLDADKALPLFDHRIKPHVVAERSQIKLPVPMAAKIGAFRPTNRGKNIKADKTYYMIFGNPDRHVKTGEKVTVVIGDFKVEHLMVN